MMPLTPDDLHELARLLHAVLSDRRVEHQQHLVRRAFDLARRDALDLVELVHQVHARVQAAGRIHEDGVELARLGGLDRVEHHRGRIRVGLRPHEVDIGALRPDLELLDGRRAERVGRADQRRLALQLEQVRQLADRTSSCRCR